MVAVDTCDSVAIASADRDIGTKSSGGKEKTGACCRATPLRQGPCENVAITRSYQRDAINLLNLLYHFAGGEFRFGLKHATLMRDEST